LQITIFDRNIANLIPLQKVCSGKISIASERCRIKEWGHTAANAVILVAECPLGNVFMEGPCCTFLRGIPDGSVKFYLHINFSQWNQTYLLKKKVLQLIQLYGNIALIHRDYLTILPI
jgi:hypothetical protein